MVRRIINIGSSPNAKDGDIVRDAFNKVNQNFEELYTEITNIEVGAVTWEAILDKPIIPTDISQLTDTQGLLATTFDGGGAASEFSEEETIDGGAA
jgi:hypothetical protein